MNTARYPRRDRARSIVSTAAIALAMGLAACSQPVDEVESPAQPSAASPNTSEGSKPEMLLAGGGLAGLRLLSPSERLSADEMAELFERAFPEQSAGKVASKRKSDGADLDAKPFAAFRSNDRTILIVENRSEEDCKACSGAVSVYYFDSQGVELTKSMPHVIESGTWGEPSTARLARLPDGRALLVLMPFWMGQGFTSESVDLYTFESAGPRQLASIPKTLGDDNGLTIGQPYEIKAIGIAPSSDSQTIKIRYAGQIGGEDGNPSRIEEERTITLDGVDDAWLKTWKYIGQVE